MRQVEREHELSEFLWGGVDREHEFYEFYELSEFSFLLFAKFAQNSQTTTKLKKIRKIRSIRLIRIPFPPSAKFAQNSQTTTKLKKIRKIRSIRLIRVPFPPSAKFAQFVKFAKFAFPAHSAIKNTVFFFDKTTTHSRPLIPPLDTIRLSTDTIRLSTDTIRRRARKALSIGHNKAIHHKKPPITSNSLKMRPIIINRDR